MSELDAIRETIREQIERYFAHTQPEPFVRGQSRMPLIAPAFGAPEVYEAVDSLLSTNLTMGEKVRAFERGFAEYIGVRHAVMVNSGSSANLVALSVLANPRSPRRLAPGDEVITPAVTWATTVWPIIQTGLTPVLVDVDRETFNIDPEQVEAAITPRTRAIMLVHLLGRPCEMDAILDIARRHALAVIEDACEAHGAEYRGRKTGSFGDLATFSFFFSHHITTIEGGMVLTDDDELAELARATRVFGWAREYDDPAAAAQRHPQIDPRYLFLDVGYNLRPTEIQGAFGMHQLGRLDGFVETRRANAAAWGDRIEALSPQLSVQREAPGTRHAWFGYPLTVRPGGGLSRDGLARHLESRGVETRPIMAGNIAEQPAIRTHRFRAFGELPNARYIHRNAFFFGNHHGVGEALLSYIAEFVASQSPAQASAA